MQNRLKVETGLLKVIKICKIKYIIIKLLNNYVHTLFSFFLHKKRNKKIKAANKKGETLSIILKLRNSPQAYTNLILMPAQTTLIS